MRSVRNSGVRRLHGLRQLEHEKAVILLVAGYPAQSAEVPDIRRKEADELIVWRE